MFRDLAWLEGTKIFVKTVETLKKLTSFINHKVLYKPIGHSLMMIIHAVIMHTNKLSISENISVAKLYLSRTSTSNKGQ